MAKLKRTRFMKRLSIRSQLANLEEQESFSRWLATHRASKSSQQTDLPSSHIAPRSSLINGNTAQLFVIVDTCSIVSHRSDFIDYITHLKKLYFKGNCPIRFIISLVVLEELDKCNRRTKKKSNPPQNNHQQPEHIDLKPSRLLKPSDRFAQNAEIQDLLELATKELDDRTNINHNNADNTQIISRSSQEPPRMFMRFIEEEMRTSEILISELDPLKQMTLNESEKNFEIVNKDDRILECCLRTRAFIRSIRHHSDTKVVLISEDNVFKSKATTFEIPSYRWREFRAKFKNFGLEHYVATPQYPRLVAKKSPAKPAKPMALKARNDLPQLFNDEDSIMIVKEVINLK